MLCLMVSLVLLLDPPGPVFAAGGSPGAARLPGNVPDNAPGLNPDILWKGPGLTLVPPGSVRNAETILPAAPGRDLYLVETREGTAFIDQSDAVVAVIDAQWSLLELPAGNRDVMLPESAVYLGYPGSVAEPAEPEAIPRDITWDARVQALVDTISEAEMTATVTALEAFQTRHSYTQGCFDAAEWLGAEYTALGYQVSFHEHDREMGPNVIAERTGVVTPEEIVIICGHYDSISPQPQTLAPGADDNGTGTAAVLHAARAAAGSYFERTVRFIAFSGEEQGLRGSQAYAQKMVEDGEQIIGVINLDMIGWSDPNPEDLDVIGNDASSDLVDLFIDCAGAYTTLPTLRVINGGATASDHAAFWTRGYPALLGIEDYPVNYPYYHTTEDTVDKLDTALMTETTRAATAAMAHLAEPMMEQVFIIRATWDDSAGDGDGYLDPGETVSVTVDLLNNSSEISGDIRLTMICLAGNQYITLTDNSAFLPSILPGQTISNTDDPFVIRVDTDVPEFADLTCIAALECSAPHSSGYFFHGTITSYQWNDAIIEYPMTIDPQWTADDALWEWGIPLGLGGDDHGFPDPDSGFTGEAVMGTNMAGDYPGGIYVTVTSPVLDLTEVRDAELHFQRWLNVEDPAYDRARIWVINGEGTHQIWGNTREITDNEWMEMELDISEVADGRNDVQIAFSLQTDDGWHYSGWNIDDIRIAGLAPGDPIPTPTPSPAPDSAGIRLVMPDTSLETGDAFSLKAEWWNSSPENYFNVAVFIVLDIEGSYWFWPAWTRELDHQSWNIPAGTPPIRTEILEFEWPEIQGSATGLKFWAALAEPDYSTLIGTYDVVEWEYH